LRGILSLSPEEVFSHPLEVTSIVFESISRNIRAEIWFYAAVVLSFIVAIAPRIARNEKIFPHFFNQKVRTDTIYGLLELTHVVQILIIVPIHHVLNSLTEKAYFFRNIYDRLHIPSWVLLIVSFVFADFVAYWWHRMQHQSIQIWQFHKTHHSQSVLTPLTTFRATILDRIVATFALSTPMAVLHLGYEFPLVIVLILQIHQLILHSDSGLSFGPLDRILVSPSFHETHHSIKDDHLDRNYGAVLSIWDRMFGTFAPRGKDPLVYGLLNEQIALTYLRQQIVPIEGLRALYSKASASKSHPSYPGPSAT
jgi:sterol desaturase/sphingolipid hydroxylase (fatty acid hydroxylase superfamily)